MESGLNAIHITTVCLHEADFRYTFISISQAFSRYPIWILARNWLSWLKIFIVFLSSSRKLPAKYLQIGHNHFLIHHYFLASFYIQIGTFCSTAASTFQDLFPGQIQNPKMPFWVHTVLDLTKNLWRNRGPINIVDSWQLNKVWDWQDT